MAKKNQTRVNKNIAVDPITGRLVPLHDTPRRRYKTSLRIKLINAMPMDRPDPYSHTYHHATGWAVHFGPHHLDHYYEFEHSRTGEFFYAR